MPNPTKYRYLGPSDFFVYKDVAYTPGQDVPLTEAEMQHHRQFGSAQFEGYEPIFTAPVNGSPEDMVPFDDAGRPQILGSNGQILKPGSNAWKEAMAAKGMPKATIDAQAEAAKAEAAAAVTAAPVGASAP